MKTILVSITLGVIVALGLIIDANQTLFAENQELRAHNQELVKKNHEYLSGILTCANSGTLNIGIEENHMWFQCVPLREKR